MKIVVATLVALILIVGGFVYLGHGPAPDAGLQRTTQSTGESAAGRSQDMSARSAEDQGDSNEQGTRAREIQATGSGDVPLSPEQRAGISSYFAKHHSTRTDPGQTSVSIGASVPRQIATEPLPPQVVEIMGKFRGDEYFVAGDRLVVVEPKSRRIVAIVPLAG